MGERGIILIRWSNAHPIDGDPVDFEPLANANPRPSDPLPDNTFFMEFVPYLQSLERLVAWPHPKYWSELQRGSVVMDDVKDIAFPTGAKMPKYVKVLIDDANEHWVVQAKPITRVGSFVAPSWVPGIEGPFGSCLDDEQQSEEDDFDDEDGDEGSEDYFEDEEDDSPIQRVKAKDPMRTSPTKNKK
ncbi:hypothetical protein DPV78_009474 [Talaromyces pinophilus]|nr:hypothetical protein DPV78_009474 [Talaromyces pinophilus]